jgi:hypothetical protein
MIIITDLEVMTVKEDTFRYLPTLERRMFPTDEPFYGNSQVAFEFIRGKKFRWSCHGQESSVTLGLTKKVRDLIGIPFDCIEDMQQQVADLNIKLSRADLALQRSEWEVADLKAKLNQIDSAHWWDKLTWALTGKLKS